MQAYGLFFLVTVAIGGVLGVRLPVPLRREKSRAAHGERRAVGAGGTAHAFGGGNPDVSSRRNAQADRTTEKAGQTCSLSVRLTGRPYLDHTPIHDDRGWTWRWRFFGNFADGRRPPGVAWLCLRGRIRTAVLAAGFSEKRREIRFLANFPDRRGRYSCTQAGCCSTSPAHPRHNDAHQADRHHHTR